MMLSLAKFVPTRSALLLGGLFLPALCLTAAADDAPAPHLTRTFLQNHCFDCHQGAGAEGGLDLAAFSPEATAEPFPRWVRIVDRVRDGEMPPPEIETLDRNDVEQFVSATGDWLREQQRRQWAAAGRVRGRRLTNLQLERTLHDLLGIDIPLASDMPEEPRTDGFTTVADGQSMSHFQLERHLTTVDAALDEAFRRAVRSDDEDAFRKTFDARALSRRRPKSRTREPEQIGDAAVVWSSRLIFYGRLPVTTARESGWYRFTIRASALKSPPDHGVWCTVRSGRCVSSSPLLAWLGAFEATKKQGEWTFEGWLPAGHMLEVRPGDGTLKMAKFSGGQVGTGEGGPQNVPGVAIHSVTMQRIHRGPSNEQIRRALFGGMQLVRGDGKSGPRLVSDNPRRDLAVQMRQFARRAFRRPVLEADVAPYVALAQQALDDGTPLLETLRGGYRSLLCSPRFLYFQEEPGRLDDHAIACRLSYFLWNTMPDGELVRLADEGKLSDPQVLREQVDRMLRDQRGRNFVQDFAAQWLDLSLIDFTEPDRRMYRDFDIIVQQSMLDETHMFLQEMLDCDAPVTNLIDSKVTFLNSRLARYYDIGSVEGDSMRPVALGGDDHRGGVLTQGAILKVTANGTTTSPVIRGVWVSERLLGRDIPPPPAGVPAIEPDVRGAKTIREMLAKHRADSSCAACHVKIDPPGFALENYDPAGQWRDTYALLQSGRKKRGAPIDASYDLPDGRHFSDIDEFRRLVLADPRDLARNAAKKLLTYGTGAPVAFADRPAVEAIVAETAASKYGFRSLVQAVVTSPVFLTK